MFQLQLLYYVRFGSLKALSGEHGSDGFVRNTDSIGDPADICCCNVYCLRAISMVVAHPCLRWTPPFCSSSACPYIIVPRLTLRSSIARVMPLSPAALSDLDLTNLRHSPYHDVLVLEEMTTSMRWADRRTCVRVEGQTAMLFGSFECFD